MNGIVIAVSARSTHSVSKDNRPAIRLLRGLGVEGDAHLGARVQHRSRVARDPSQPNLRQVHLIHSVVPGLMGENITTRGVDLLALPTGTRLLLGPTALVEVTGLRNPCTQLDGLQPGLRAATLARDSEGNLIRKAGIMAVVLADGLVQPGDPITVELPALPHRPLAPV
jgi:MOSC domain-containing protein YiiM